MSHLVKIKSIEHVTHDVLHLQLEKPSDISYTPGQAVDISINKPDWEKVKSCFTFTSLPEDNDIEFTIKTYPQRDRVTNQLLQAKAGDEVFIYKPFGDIKYKGEGIFLAGGEPCPCCPFHEGEREPHGFPTPWASYCDSARWHLSRCERPPAGYRPYAATHDVPLPDPLPGYSRISPSGSSTRRPSTFGR